MARTPAGSKPGSNFASAAKLRPNSAAPTSSVTVTAIWPATITCSVRPLTPPRASIAPSRRSCASDCVPIDRSGDRPITTVISTPRPTTNASVRQSMPGAAKLGSCTGLSASSASPAHIASRHPAVPPSATTHALSDSIKRTSRRSSAPIARRSENSRRRDSVRASNRLATLAHAITSTNADRAEQQRDRRPDLPEHFVGERRHFDAAFLVALGIRLRELLRDVGDVGLRLLDARHRAPAGQRGESAVAARRARPAATPTRSSTPRPRSHRIGP